MIVHLWYLSWKLGCRYFGSQWFGIAFCFRSTLLIKDLIFRRRLTSIILTMVFIFWIAPWQNHVTLNCTFNFCLFTRKALIIRFTWRWFYRVSRAWVFVRSFFSADGVNILLHVVQTKRGIDKHADVDDHHYSNWSEKQRYNVLSADNNWFCLINFNWCMFVWYYTYPYRNKESALEQLENQHVSSPKPGSWRSEERSPPWSMLLYTWRSYETIQIIIKRGTPKAWSP